LANVGTIYKSGLIYLGGLLLVAPSHPAAADPQVTDSQWSNPTGSSPGSAALEHSQAAPLATPTRLDRSGRVLIPVTLNGHGPFRFVVDTGANHSTISPRTAQALAVPLQTNPAITVRGITGSDEFPSIAIEELRAGGWVVHDLQLPVVSAPMFADADGILGAAGMTSERLLVDFLHNSVAITRAHARSAVAAFARIPGRRVAGGLLMVPALIGRVRADAIIDTGSERSLGNLALRYALHAKRPDDPEAFVTPVYGATSAVSSGEVHVAPLVVLGSARIERLPVVYGDFYIFKVWGLEARPALLLGMDALGTLDALAIDFDAGEVYVRTRDMDASGYTISHLATH
jgi:Aspartyl protease